MVPLFQLSMHENTGVRALFSTNCETGETSVDSNGTYHTVAPTLGSFSPGRKPTADQLTNGDATVTLLDSDEIQFLPRLFLFLFFDKSKANQAQYGILYVLSYFSFFRLFSREKVF